MVECGVMFDWRKERLRCNLDEGHEEPHGHNISDEHREKLDIEKYVESIDGPEMTDEDRDAEAVAETITADLIARHKEHKHVSPAKINADDIVKTCSDSICGVFKYHNSEWFECASFKVGREHEHAFVRSVSNDKIQWQMLDMILDHRAAKEELEPGSEKLKKILASKRDELRQHLAGLKPRANGCLEIYGLYSDNKGDYCYICNKPTGHTGQHDGEKTDFTSIVKRMKAIQKVEKGIAKYEKQEKEQANLKEQMSIYTEPKVDIFYPMLETGQAPGLILQAMIQELRDYVWSVWQPPKLITQNDCLAVYGMRDENVAYICTRPKHGKEIIHWGDLVSNEGIVKRFHAIQDYESQINKAEIIRLQASNSEFVKEATKEVVIPELCGQAFEYQKKWFKCDLLKDHYNECKGIKVADPESVEIAIEKAARLEQERREKFPMLCEKKYQVLLTGYVCTLSKGHTGGCDGVVYNEAYKLNRQKTIEEDRAEIKAKLVAEMEAKGIPGKQKGTGFTGLTEAQLLASVDDRLTNKNEPDGFEKVAYIQASKKPYVPEYATGRTIDGDHKISHEPPQKELELHQVLHDAGMLVDTCKKAIEHYLFRGELPPSTSKENLKRISFLADIAHLNYPE